MFGIDVPILDDALELIEENIVDPLLETGENAANWVSDEVDALLDAADDILESIEENVLDPAIEVAEDLKEWLVDTIERIGNAIEEGMDGFTEFMKDFFAKLGDVADLALDLLVDAASDSWNWVTEKVDAAVDWLVEAGEKVIHFVIEEAIPFIVSLVSFIPSLLKLVGALLVLPLCYLYKRFFGDEEATVIQGIAAHEPRLMEEFMIARLPVEAPAHKYVVFSDVHMFVEGDLDFFNNNGNSELYRHALDWYSSEGYHLIENGDIEDFWMRGGSSKGLIFTISDQLPWPYYSELFESSAFRAANQVHAFNVFLNNADTYSVIRTEFHDRERYTRLIGNHDDVWSDSAMEHIIQFFYPNIMVFDYCTLEREDTGETEILVAHGHQSDTFNTPMCNFAGKAVTEFASHLNEITLGEFDIFTKSKDWWEEQWSDKGFKNELQKIDLLKRQSFSEHALYKGLENIYGDSPSQPYLILGHTHDPKDSAGIPDWMYREQWNWDEYSNSGTAGMWEEIIVGLEVEYPDVRVIAWKKGANGIIGRHELKSYRYGDAFLKA